MNEWITCEDRLPKYHEDVLVCTADGEIKISWRKSDDEFCDYEDEIVIAWMPLPKPYNSLT